MMLVKYRDDYEKTTMGLLSFLPDFHSVKHLTGELDWYKTGHNRQMYLWKNADNQFTGVVGLECLDEVVLVRQLVLSPQDRNDTTRAAILNAVAELFPQLHVMGTIATTPMIMRWQNLDGH
ncbi:N-acetyltransferase [Furfurilactobacillus siliginis]|nr:N-acetyltransferase [Furfurilactobacillus siliginis]